MNYIPKSIKRARVRNHYIQKAESVYQFDDYQVLILWRILVDQAIYIKKEYQVNPEHIQKVPVNS